MLQKERSAYQLAVILPLLVAVPVALWSFLCDNGWESSCCLVRERRDP